MEATHQKLDGDCRAVLICRLYVFSACRLTVDYSHSPIHRFKRSSGAAGSGAAGGLGIHAKSIHPPSQVLHVSSLADAVTEEELRELLQSHTAASTGTAASSSGEQSELEEKEREASSQPPVVQFFTSTPRAALPAAAAPKTSKQAFVRFSSVTAAVEALIAFHNYNLHGRYLRISFSAKDPQQVHDTLNGNPIHPQPSQAQSQPPQQTQQVQPSARPAAAQSPAGSTNANAASPAPASSSSPSAGAEGQAAPRTE
jgi:RNA recognition motif-containing protein